MLTEGATLPPAGLPGLDPAWSRLVTAYDGDAVKRTWHVLDTGTPAPRLTLLCLHGNPTWSYLWRRLLAAAPWDWRVVAPDQLGMGYSDRLEQPRTLTQRTADLGYLTAALAIDGPTVIVAHDWGGPITLGWALRHRPQLRGVVLTNTAVHQPVGKSSPALIRLAHLRGLRDAVCVRTATFVAATSRLSRPALDPEIRAALAAPYAVAERRTAIGDFVADIPFSTNHPSRGTLDRLGRKVRTLEVPVLLLWGARDPVFGQTYLGDLLDRMPHADVHRYQTASHLVTEDAPEYADTIVHWVADAVLDADESHDQSQPDQPDQADGSDPGHAPAHDPDDTTGSAGSTLCARLDARAGDHGPAVVDVGRRTVGWNLLARRVDEIASGLAAAGVGPGNRVALLVPPSADLTAAVYAVWKAGAVIVVADKGLGLRSMGRALRSAGVDHVIGTAQGLAAAKAMRLPGTRIGTGRIARATLRLLGGDLTLGDLATLGRRLPAPTRARTGDECAVVFTSGATGPAKGVVYRYGQVEAQLRLVRATYQLSDDDRIVAAFAPFSLYGPALGIGSAVPEMDVTSPGTLTASALAEAVRAIGGTVVFASPAALRNVVSTASALSDAQHEALMGVRLLMSAGAPVPTRLLRDVRTVLPNADLHTPYGMTEALPVTDISLEQIETAGAGDGVCVGQPLPGVDVALSLLSPTGTADEPPVTVANQVGEICVRADHVKDHYDALWGTQRSSSRNQGWHRTGDVGHLDDQGRLWVAGRLQHVITTASGVVTPVGVEQRVESLAQVRAAAVVGIGPTGTQQVAVVVVPVRRVRRLSPVTASVPLTDQVRSVAGVDLAAVLVVASLPVDIRHASKVDRTKVASWATRVLAGG